VKKEIQYARRGFTPPGFTLVELLTVIGIVALLVAILLPALGRARERANAVQCLATLRNMGTAAHMHANDHLGYLPTAGRQWKCVGGVCDPRGMEDAAKRKYEYYTDGAIERPVPVTVALGKYLGVPCRTESREAMVEDMAGEALRKHFRCPSQQAEYQGWTQGDESGSWVSPDEYSSYCFNEALLGRRDQKITSCPKGKLSRVREPSKVMFAMDGRPRDNGLNRWLLVPEPEPADATEATLYDFQQMVLGAVPAARGVELLDFGRHGLRVNVLYCDGHAESVPTGLPPEGGEGLKQVYVSRGINW
jgi:prepilin-type processing-associated H-X9-DG protein/prepilin-type N-terminal cleavage/methylation domain-containing protein